MIRIITPLYNAKKYIGYCLASVNMQTNLNWKCYIIDNCSTDGSTDLVEKLIEGNDKFELIRNKNNIGTAGSHYNIIHKEEIDDDDICVDLDGDDWFNGEGVLEKVLEQYKDGTLMTYGQFVHWDGQNYTNGFAGSCPTGCSNVRKTPPWTTTALRTYKAGLFRKIDKKDLMLDDGETYFPVTGDLAFMIPMLEMAGDKRVKFVEDILYIYNIESDMNDYKIHLPEQKQYELVIRNRPKYKELPW